MTKQNSFILAFEVSVHLAGNHEGLHSAQLHVHISLCMCELNIIIIVTH